MSAVAAPADAQPRKWFLSYTCSRPRRDGPSEVHVGHCVSLEHPILRVRRWNDAERRRQRETELPMRTTVLNWYAPLSPEEESLLAAGGLPDVTTIDETATTAD